METAFKQSTARTGSRIGPFPPIVLENHLRFQRVVFSILVVAGPFLFLCGTLLLLVSSFYALSYVFIALGILFTLGALALFFWNSNWVPVAAVATAALYHRGAWIAPGHTIWVPRWDHDRGQGPRMFYLNSCQATWQTPVLTAADGQTVQYDVAITLHISPKAKDKVLMYDYLPDEALYQLSILESVKQTIRQTVSGSQPQHSTLKQTPFIEALQRGALNNSKQRAKDMGIVIDDIYIHNPQLGTSVPSKSALPARPISAGDKDMNEMELVRKLQTEYNVSIPSVFDPAQIKRDMEVLHNTGLLKGFVSSLSSRFKKKEQIELLRAWQEFYDQVGKTAEASHAAQFKLQEAEARHHLFLQKCVAESHSYQADTAEARARIAEARLREVVAAKSMKDTIEPTEKPASQPPHQPTFDERRAAIERSYATKIESIKSAGHKADTERRLLRIEEDAYEKDLKKAYETFRP